MSGHQTGRLLLTLSLVWLTSSQMVSGQIFVRQSHHHDKHVGEPWCGLQECLPKLETYGFFRENWRRWPGEMQATQSDDLKPFVTPDRSSVPDSVLPDPRDEASQVQRERTPVRPPGSGFTPSPDTSTPETGPVAPGTGLDNGGILPNDLGNEEPGNVFPSGDLPQDGLPEAFPSGELPNDLDDQQPETGDGFELDPGDSLDLPGLDDGDLEDLNLGLNRPKQNQAQVSPRRSGDVAAPRQIDLVSAQSLADEVHVHIRTATSRRNPLRRSLKTRFATQRQATTVQHQARRQQQRVAPASYSPSATRRVKVRPAVRRENPLR